MSLTVSNRIHYYYENILRYDLLLKLNYNNIMQIPQLRKIIIVAYGVPSNNVKSVSLALEIICGQKVFCSYLSPDGQTSRGAKRPTKPQRGRDMSRSVRALQPGKLRTKKADPRVQSWKNRGRISNLQFDSTLLYSSLRVQKMYNFLEKLLTVLTASYDYKTQIQGQEVQITLSNRELRLFPEIQNHFEFFECFQAVEIKLVTSARCEAETQLLWTGLQQKEI